MPHDSCCSAGSEVFASSCNRRYYWAIPGASAAATNGGSGIIVADPFHCGRHLVDRERQTVEVVVERYVQHSGRACIRT